MKKIISTVSMLATMALASGCSPELIGTDANSLETAKEMQLTRKTQRVVRYNCNDSIFSDKIETVNSPKRSIQLVPVNTRVEIVSSSFQNKTNNNGPGAITNHTGITIDIASATFTMKVEPGINEIEYTFGYIDGSAEEGSRFLNINYVEEHLDEKREVKPTAEECK